MARTVAKLPAGSRISDHISLGVITKTFPRHLIDGVLERTGRASLRERQLPAPVMMYYVIALALYAEASYGEVLRCLLEGLRWPSWSFGVVPVAGKSGISQARSRLGVEPVKQLYQQAVGPLAQRETKGAWYGDWRLVSIDGSTQEVANEAANVAAFGRPGASRGRSAYPQHRFVCLVKTGSHVLFGAELGAYTSGEQTLSQAVVERLKPNMLCLADRGFFSFALWSQAAATGAALLWRVEKNQIPPCQQRLSDGSYLSTIYASAKDRRQDRQGRLVRVIEYRLKGIAGAEPLYRLITTITDPAEAPARELAALHQERWEIETAIPPSA